MTAPDAADILNGLRATTARDDATHLAQQLKAATGAADVALWALIVTFAVVAVALVFGCKGWWDR